jgi:tyrosinase
MSFDRRFVLKASMTAAVSAYLTGFEAVPSAQVARRRHNVASADGKAMLAKYAKAVGLMQDPKKFPPSDPRSWNFQWYTHWVPGPQPWAAAVVIKSDMIKKIFGGTPANDPNRQLADLMWDTCQRHSFNPADPNFFQELFFCVWHRWYLYYFEDIVRGVLDDDAFTLPY